MIIIGAKGLAKELLEILYQKNETDNLYFYDDISTDTPDKLYDQFPILKNLEEVTELFKIDNRFIVGIGNPELRKQMFEKFKIIGGEITSAISPLAYIGHYSTNIGAGTIVMAGSFISNDVRLGIGCLVNPNCTISHDTVIGNFVEISPGVQITGNCVVGNYVSIGTNATILPKIHVGERAIVGAGAVVTIKVPNGITVVGVPAKQIRVRAT